MAEIKYQRAYIDNDPEKIISIKEITKENRNQYKYYCIGCGKELLPRAIESKYRKPHFYHKEIVECSGETYLHKLAKKVIKKKFNEQSSFIVGYPVNSNCSKTDCKYYSPYCRESDSLYQINLKDYYDTCEEESPVKGFEEESLDKVFIADILLTNSTKPDIEPVLIEICVSHPCDEEKRNSGLKIIEIKIRNEQEIDELEQNDVLLEKRFGLIKERNVEFISFKREINERRTAKIDRYILNSMQNPNGYITQINCSKAKYKLRTASILELNLVNRNTYMRADIFTALLWQIENKGIRRCNFCKFYYATANEDYAICRLSKNYGKPMYPSMDEAERCNSYSFENYLKIDNYFIEEVTAVSPVMKPEYKVILAVSRSFDKYDLFKEKFMYYLSEKMKTHTLIVLSGASKATDYLIDQLSNEIDFIQEPHEASWEKYERTEAIRKSNEEMTDSANAIIAFWDGKSFGIADLIERAKNKNIMFRIVRY